MIYNSDERVKYCGHHCQAAHWRDHKKVCKSSLAKSSWLPEWDRSNRNPAWASDTASRNLHNPFGSDKHLWGNTPAIDILQIERNEGLDYGDDVALLFAGSLCISHHVDVIYPANANSFWRPEKCREDSGSYSKKFWSWC